MNFCWWVFYEYMNDEISLDPQARFKTLHRFLPIFIPKLQILKFEFLKPEAGSDSYTKKKKKNQK